MIRYRNIYHMLSYAFSVLEEQGYEDIALEEDFENGAELLSAILCHGVSVQIKRGLMRAYLETDEVLTSPRGRIEISESIKSLSIRKKQLVCVYDDFSVNAYNNRIIKTTFEYLLKAKISKERKKEIKKLAIYFSDVESLDIHSINWSQRYDRNNQSYKMIISLCYMILNDLLQTTDEGQVNMYDFSEQLMSRLYERFILKYFCKHYPEIKTSSSQIPWVLAEDSSSAMLPIMQSDIMLSFKERVLIIDAKYYSHNTQVQYDKHAIHSNNLYQIFTYVKNKEAELKDKPHEVSGMLLYAHTDDEIQPDQTYWMSGNKISVKTLNLDCEFKEIADQLNEIAEKFLITQA